MDIVDFACGIVVFLRHVCTEESLDWVSFFDAQNLIFPRIRGFPKHAMMDFDCDYF